AAWTAMSSSSHAKLSAQVCPDAVDRRVPIYIYKQEALDDVERRYPATTVFLRQGTYAHDPKVVSAFPPADVTIECIRDLLHSDFLRPGTTSRSCVQPKGDAMRPTRALHELGQSLW